MGSRITYLVFAGAGMPGFEVGSHVEIWGRIQSREYVKKIGENITEKRVAYEVSVSKVERLE